ncbi:Small heat shock protein IbpA [Ensifer adhaerens]|nr:Small heat shock protein IbpA [Ensifer adhaerens]
MAVAGFAEDELTITHEANMLVVNGGKSEDEEVQYLHHGLALRPFARRFELADHVIVEGAKLENGLLVIDLRKEMPEEMKPRRIAIESEMTKPASKQIQGDKAA